MLSFLALSRNACHTANNVHIYIALEYSFFFTHTHVVVCISCHSTMCVFFPFTLDVEFVGCTSRGHTGGSSHRISHPTSFCGACLYFSCENDSAVSFPRRPWSRVLYTNDFHCLLGMCRPKHRKHIKRTQRAIPRMENDEQHNIIATAAQLLQQTRSCTFIRFVHSSSSI